MARLYANENFPLPVVEQPRRLGHDVATIQESGRANQRVPDQAVLESALVENRAVLTLNRKHFVRLHQQTPRHAGIVVCSVEGDFLGQAERIHDRISEAGDLTGKLLRINRPSA